MDKLKDCDEQFKQQLIILLTGLARKGAKYYREIKKLETNVSKLKQRLQQRGPTEFNHNEELKKLKNQFKKHEQFKENVKQSIFLPEIRQEENAYRLSLKKNSQRVERLAIVSHVRGISKRQYSNFQTDVCLYFGLDA